MTSCNCKWLTLSEGICEFCIEMLHAAEMESRLIVLETTLMTSEDLSVVVEKAIESADIDSLVEAAVENVHDEWVRESGFITHDDLERELPDTDDFVQCDDLREAIEAALDDHELVEKAGAGAVREAVRRCDEKNTEARGFKAEAMQLRTEVEAMHEAIGVLQLQVTSMLRPLSLWDRVRLLFTGKRPVLDITPPWMAEEKLDGARYIHRVQ